jgi:hypothetical protein
MKMLITALALIATLIHPGYAHAAFPGQKQQDDEDREEFMHRMLLYHIDFQDLYMRHYKHFQISETPILVTKMIRTSPKAILNDESVRIWEGDELPRIMRDFDERNAVYISDKKGIAFCLGIKLKSKAGIENYKENMRLLKGMRTNSKERMKGGDLTCPLLKKIPKHMLNEPYVWVGKTKYNDYYRCLRMRKILPKEEFVGAPSCKSMYDTE